jgi:hypothetical protein
LLCSTCVSTVELAPDNVAPQINPPVFTPPSPANVTTGDIVTIVVTTDSSVPNVAMKLLFGGGFLSRCQACGCDSREFNSAFHLAGNSTSVPLSPLSVNADNTSFVYT